MKIYSEINTDPEIVGQVWYEILMEAEERRKKQQQQQLADIQSAHNKDSEKQKEVLASDGIVLKEEE